MIHDYSAETEIVWLKPEAKDLPTVREMICRAGAAMVPGKPVAYVAAGLTARVYFTTDKTPRIGLGRIVATESIVVGAEATAPKPLTKIEKLKCFLSLRYVRMSRILKRITAIATYFRTGGRP